MMSRTLLGSCVYKEQIDIFTQLNKMHKQGGCVFSLFAVFLNSRKSWLV